MIIASCRELLQSVGLGEPTLSILVPNEHNYRALILQPAGRIVADASGVRNEDAALANSQHGDFLRMAHQARADLAVTPEYSTPWESLCSAVEAGRLPEEGAVWVLGCESVSVDGLKSIAERLAGMARVVHEPLESIAGRFLDPLVYVFRCRRATNNELELVLLVQLKTKFSADPDHFEINGLQLGSTVYEFGPPHQPLRLLTLICSDSLGFTDEHARDKYDRALILHVQLNKKPRQADFRHYRDRLLQFRPRQTEILCVNWAGGVRMRCGTVTEDWRNIGGSAWYLNPEHFDQRDESARANHKRGLYYTWLATRHAHALFFNYSASVFDLVVTKVAHIGVSGPLSKSFGPKVSDRFSWAEDASQWVSADATDDGFSALVGELEGAAENLSGIAAECPIVAERLLALCAGRVKGPNWFDLSEIDSFSIDDSEVVRRITFCQDPDEGAAEFRLERLKRCAHLWHAVSVSFTLPRALEDLRTGLRLDWSKASPHQNAVGANGDRATIVYVGEGVGRAGAEEVGRRLSDYLRRTETPVEGKPSSRQRLLVLYRDVDQMRAWEPYRSVSIDGSPNESEFGIARGR